MTVEGNERTATSSTTPQVCRNHAGTFDYGWVAQLPQATLTPNVFIFRQDVATKATETFDLSTIVNNPFNMPLQGDGHFTMGVVSDADEKVHVVGNLHADPLDGPGTQRHYGYTTWPPNTSSSWTFPAWSSLPASTVPGGANSHTYFRWTRNTAGDILGLWEQEDGTNYHRFWTLQRLPAHTTTWEFVDPANKKLTSGVPSAGATADPGVANRIYSHLTLVGDRIHITSVFADVNEATSGFWRQEHTYMWADPPYTTWRTIDNQTVTLPLTWANRTAALIGSRPDRSANMAPQVAVDNLNRPYVSYDHVDGAGAQVTASLWYQCYWNGSAWAANIWPSGSNVLTQSGPGSVGNIWWTNQCWTYHNQAAVFGDKGTSRFKLRNAAANLAVAVGGAADTHMNPYACPISIRDRARPRFLIPDGNQPMVYEFMAPIGGRV